MSTTVGSARTAGPRQLLTPVKPTNPSNVPSVDGVTHSMEVDIASLTGNNQHHEDLSKNGTTPRRFPEELCIPKIELSDQSYFIDDEALADFGLTQPLIPFTTPYKLKDPVIELERCDKIWETLTLIKNAQGGCDDYIKEDDTEEEATPVKDPSSTECGLPYVQYEPVLENNNANIKLSVMTTEKLHNCLTCGNFFSKKRDLQAHVYKFHGIDMPLNDLKQNTANQTEVKIAKVRPTERAKCPNPKQNVDKVRHTDKLKKPDLPSMQDKGGFEIHNLKQGKTEDVERQTSVSPFEGYSDQDKALVTGYVSCSLCNNHIKDVKKHLNSYHKIVCSDMMLTQFCKPISPEGMRRLLSKIKDKKKPLQSDTVEAPPTAIIRSSLSPVGTYQDGHVGLKRRRMSDVSCGEPKKRHIETQPVEKQRVEIPTCSLCSAMFTSRQGLSNHVRACKTLQERKSVSVSQPGNTDTSLHNRQQLKSPNTVINQVTKGTNRTTRKSDKYVTGEVDSKLINGTGENVVMGDKLSNGTEQIAQNICGCGRQFRTAYTYNAHKARCTVKSNTVDQEVRSNSDRSPSGGLHLTIKKHNNSYEIVGRDNDGTSAPQSGDTKTETHSDASKIANKERVEQKETSAENLAEYSRSHRFVKLEVVDEDIVVDIEDDTTNNFLDDANNRTETNATENELKSDTPDKENLQDENALGNELVSVNNRIKYVCPCGEGFKTEESMQGHIKTYHALLCRKCGYCQNIFKSMAELNDHRCMVIKGEPYVNLYKIPCCYCNKIMDAQHLDDHIKQTHLVSTENPFTCYECFKCFATLDERRRHFNTNHKRSVSCPFCIKTITTRRRPRHLAYHFGMGFPCHVCKLAFLQPYHLKDHRQGAHPPPKKEPSS